MRRGGAKGIMVVVGEEKYFFRTMCNDVNKKRRKNWEKEKKELSEDKEKTVK